MAVDGAYMAWRVRTALTHLRAYGECVRQYVLPAFFGLEKKADEIAEAEFERLGSMPVGEDWNGDMATLAERAHDHDKGLAYYEVMAGVRQGILNLLAVGLFHLLEQELADLCSDGSFEVPPPKDTKLDVVVDWYSQHFAIDLRALPSWPESMNCA